MSSPKFEWRQWSPNVHCGSDQVRNGRTDLHLFVRAISLLPVTHHHHLSEQIPCPSVRGFFPNPAQQWVCQPRTRIRASEVPSHLVREKGEGKGSLLPIFSSIAPSVTSHRYSKAVGLIFCKPRAARVTLIMGREISGTLSRSPFVQPPTTLRPSTAPCAWNDTFERVAKLSPN